MEPLYNEAIRRRCGIRPLYHGYGLFLVTTQRLLRGGRLIIKAGTERMERL
jgi:hypothetical protein